MEGFPVLTLHPILQEKIIRKTQWRSYFHLQQTCRAMKNAIQKSRNHTIQIDEAFGGKYEENQCDWEITYLSLNSRAVKYPVKASTLYGCRLRSFDIISTGDMVDYSYLRYILKTNRITCEKVMLEDSLWTGEDWMKLLAILKPTRINYYNTEGDITYFEALLKLGQLKSADLYLDLDSARAVNIALKFRFICEELEIHIQDSSNPYFLIQYVLQKVRSEYLPNLNKFLFRIAQHNFEHKELLEDPNLKHELGNLEDKFTATMALPQHFPKEPSCKVIVDRRRFVNIRYTRGTN